MTTQSFDNKRDIIKHEILNEHNRTNDILYKQNLSFALRYIIEGIKINSDTMIIEYFRWMLDNMRHRGYDVETVKQMFESLQVRIKHYFGATLFDTITFDTITQPEAPSGIQNDDSSHPHKPYLHAVLAKDKHKAHDIVHQNFNDGMPIDEIYTTIIQPALYEIGHLWQTGEITVADEHLATVISQYVLTTLYPFIFATENHQYKAVGTSIGNERHEIGIRMIMDMFEYYGWITQYLGANTPKDSFIKFIKDYQPDLVALSLTLSIHFSDLKDTVKQIKADPALNHVKVIIGGQPFKNNKRLIQQSGADAYAQDIKEALKVGEQLVKK